VEKGLILLIVGTLVGGSSWAGAIGEAEMRGYLKGPLSTLQRLNNHEIVCEDQDCSFLQKLVEEDSRKIITVLGLAPVGRLKNEKCDEKMRSATIDDGLNSKKNFQEAYSGLGEFNASFAGRCSLGDQSREKNGLSKFYYYSNRFYETEKINLIQMATNDRLLGGTILLDVDCSKLRFDETRKQCESIQKSKCHPATDWNKIAEGTIQATRELKETKNQISTLATELQEKKSFLSTLYRNSPYSGDKIKERVLKEIETITEQIAQRQSLISLNIQKFPWLMGKKFNDLKPKNIGSSSQNISEEQKRAVQKAITEQLKVDKKGLKEKQSALSENLECLYGNKDCSIKNFLDYADNLESSTSSQNPSVNNLLEAQACYHEAKVEQLETEKEVQQMTVDASLMLVGSVGLWTRAFRGASFAVKGYNIGARGVATAAVFGTSAYYTSKSLPKAIAACTSEKENLIKKSKVLEEDFSKACSLDLQNQYEESFDRYAGCVQEGIFAALDALPMAMGVASLRATYKTFRSVRAEEAVAQEKTRLETVAVSALDKRAKQIVGAPEPRAYFQVSETQRLRKYKVDGVEIMRLEEAKPLNGSFTAEEVSALKQRRMQTRGTRVTDEVDGGIIAVPDKDHPGKFIVSSWEPTREISVDKLTQTIAAGIGSEGETVLNNIIASCSQKSDCKKAAIFIDINNLGLVNYFNNGTRKGDDYLKQALTEIQKELRGGLGAQRGADPVFRIGGDEFMVIVDIANVKPGGVDQAITSISHRIGAIVRQDPKIREIFQSHLHDFDSLAKSAQKTNSLQEVSPEFREYLQKTTSWQALDIKGQQAILSGHGPEYQRSLSDLLTAQRRRLEMIEPGAATGSHIIQSGDSFENIKDSTSEAMKRSKKRSKPLDLPGKADTALPSR